MATHASCPRGALAQKNGDLPASRRIRIATVLNDKRHGRLSGKSSCVVKGGDEALKQASPAASKVCAVVRGLTGMTSSAALCLASSSSRYKHKSKKQADRCSGVIVEISAR